MFSAASAFLLDIVLGAWVFVFVVACDCPEEEEIRVGESPPGQENPNQQQNNFKLTKCYRF